MLSAVFVNLFFWSKQIKLMSEFWRPPPNQTKRIHMPRERHMFPGSCTVELLSIVSHNGRNIPMVVRWHVSGKDNGEGF